MSDEAIAVFQVEARENLELIEQGLLDLLDRPEDRDLVDAVFRGLHTLKGSGSMFGFDALAAFTHHCETAFDRVRKGEVAATTDLVSAVLAARDHMRQLMEDPSGDYGAAGDLLLADLERAVQEADGAGPPAVVTPGLTTWRIKFDLPANAFKNGANPLALLAELREMGEARVVADASRVPPLSQIEPTDHYLAWDVTLTTDQDRATIEDVFIFVIDDMNLSIEALDEARLGASPVQAAAVAEPVEPAPAKVAAPVAAPVAVQAAAAVANDPVEASGAKTAKAVESVRVPADRLDELMDRVGELVIAQSRLTQISNSGTDTALRAVSEEIERLSGELRDTMMVLRMVPVATLFGRFRRLVHDLARETGKAIDLSTDGETTEIDKTVIERLADPLVHLIRNAADHGLETAEDRAAAGKPATGRIRLSAHQSGGEVVITIRDDGRGIDRERVRAKAESQGLIEPGAVLSDHDLLQMIFHPGFSTAAAVTNLSGRGVGMDVVKRTIEALRGSIDIASRPGEGSEVSLRIPLTLAIIDGLLVRVGQGRYVIPLGAVEECLELSLDEDLRSRGRSFISLRNSLVPYLRLREMFETGTPPELHQKVVVVSTGTERIGLVVDQIIGDHQTVIKSMSKLHAGLPTFSGATILGDGGVALILDVGHLVAKGQQQEAQMREAI
ncbi:chemotaxis protein CheA [Brevundimonas intermedia]|uniref:Chemotaxis protein CheA n=1 Tax=Brevundimonas intermedia TaxID=74315 RepID=A0ABQ5T600_9CAUL|nr:chemotaxis protein CheA [Brevundimonas intermedia]GLK47525.1 chemotaxis protein CheA [Brevundimonas intermedia]